MLLGDRYRIRYMRKNDNLNTCGMSRTWYEILNSKESYKADVVYVA